MTNMMRRIDVIYALTVRDLMGRFGRKNLGFIWTVLEPMILTAGVMLVWSMIKEPIIHGIPVITFVMTGYMPLTLSRHYSGATIRLLRNSSGLLYHRPISHVDILLARMLLEFLSCTLAGVTIYFIVVSTGLSPSAEDPPLLLAGWLMAGWHFGVVGVLTGVLTEYWEPLEKFVQPIQYLQLPVSGAFFMVDWVPSYAQKLLLWNPSIHCYEMIRGGYLGEGIATHFSVTYLALVTLGMTFVAALAVANVREHVEIS